jgi:hypothetical protein
MDQEGQDGFVGHGYSAVLLSLTPALGSLLTVCNVAAANRSVTQAASSPAPSKIGQAPANGSNGGYTTTGTGIPVAVAAAGPSGEQSYA